MNPRDLHLGNLSPLKGPPTDLELRAVDELIGQVLESRYRIDEEVGRGGMGVVYRGTDLTLSRPVAIKTILHRQADQLTLKRFIQEAKTLAQIEHPRLVPVYAVGQDEGYHYLIMKFLEGETLAQRIKRDGRQTPSFTRDVVQQVCEALSALHFQDLIHRDIKPANLMISPEGSVTVMDLGIAKRIGEENNTTASTAIGTPRYMPPEAIDNLPLDQRSDLYSLGIIAFQMLVGETPFNGPTPMAILYQQAHQPPPQMRSLVSHIPRNLESAVEVALQKSPQDRFQNAAQMSSAFGADAQFIEPNAWRNRALYVAFISGMLGVLLLFGDVFKWRKTKPQKEVTAPVAFQTKQPDTMPLPSVPSSDSKPQKETAKKRSGKRSSDKSRKTRLDRSEPKPPSPTRIRVRINSQPQGATVSLSGRRVGRTPMTITKVEGEVQTYTLSLKGFKRQSLTVRDSDAKAVLKSKFGLY